MKSNLYIRYSKTPKNVASDMPSDNTVVPPTSLKSDSNVYAGSALVRIFGTRYYVFLSVKTIKKS